MTIQASKPIDIFSLMPTEHDKGYSTIGAKPIYGAGITLIGDPSTWDRKQKLAYIETQYAQYGAEAGRSKFVMECMLSRNLGYTTALKAKNEGLRIYERNNKHD